MNYKRKLGKKTGLRVPELRWGWKKKRVCGLNIDPRTELINFVLHFGSIAGLCWRKSPHNFYITLKVLIFACTNFRENLFSRVFIFAIEVFESFARKNFHEFCENANFRKFRELIFANYAIFFLIREIRENKFSRKFLLRKLVHAKISTFKVVYSFPLNFIAVRVYLQLLGQKIGEKIGKQMWNVAGV